MPKLSLVGSYRKKEQSQPGFERGRLLAILFADVCGSSRAMRRDEDGGLRGIVQALSSATAQVSTHDGTLRNVRGDGLFATFQSAHDAVRCALAIQAEARAAAGFPALAFRVGVHIGETFDVGGQILGDSVNVASRVESVAEPGGILVSRPVYEALRGDPALRFHSIGTPLLKNIGRDLELYRLEEADPRDRAGRLELQLLGRFSLTAADGHEILLSPDAQVLLAAVALSPEGACDRRWLENTFWGDRPEDERALRFAAAVEQLGDALGGAFGRVLRIDGPQVALLPGGLVCDAVAAREDGWNGEGPLPDLLKDFQLEGARAKDWLLRERRVLRNAICLQNTPPRPPAALATVPRPEPTAPRELPIFAVGILPPLTDGADAKASLLANILADWLSRSLSEIGAVEIHDYRGGGAQRLMQPQAPGPDILVQCRSATASDMAQIAITALRAEDRTVVWQQSAVAEQRELLGPAGHSIAAFVSYATDALLSALAGGCHVGQPGAHSAAKTAIGAVHRLLTMTGPGLDRVEADITAAYAADPKPLYLAWLAYMATFQVGERYGLRDATMEEQARAMARRALEADPHNALVLGLVAHVHSYIFRDFAFSGDLIARALEINPLCALSWDSASLLYAYTGRAEEAMQAALNARRLGRHSPYRHLFDGACCVAAAMNHKFGEAVGYGESVVAVQPEFKAVLRYLAASYGHLGDSARAREVMDKLLRLEPDLSVERLRDRNYPLPSRTSAMLVEAGLTRAGLPQHP